MHHPDSASPTLRSTALDERTRKVVEHITHRRHISRNLGQELERGQGSLGQRAADAVAGFGGSWTFVLLFGLTMLVWVSMNAWLLAWQGHTFDPYPYILLNLVLSMLAAIQAPIILMSQNRQADKDRVRSEHDYEVNLKAELEIMMLHDKIDQLQKNQWTELIALQREQLHLLADLVTQRPHTPPPAG
ncbi:DUF1003 domain-containing protein [Comamonas aquatica]|uniref:DUF1003 domain-containing protein n=1 Tax=Comamonas aquatica TaxID=225991 RepID=UPI00244BEE5B|nr:DUF1003 domain-containing protein [Comamonas aquatica]MDH0495769.1 DUF1003 domain-containing protein [Comamonas aquatica]MDH1676093.1 DUF1003 domain-containing protein [Comamonas aquatica]MDH1679715.1 DUF1003 domain-containing protein [Comamonas aquatica]